MREEARGGVPGLPRNVMLVWITLCGMNRVDYWTKCDNIWAYPVKEKGHPVCHYVCTFVHVFVITLLCTWGRSITVHSWATPLNLPRESYKFLNVLMLSALTVSSFILFHSPTTLISIKDFFTSLLARFLHTLFLQLIGSYPFPKTVHCHHFKSIQKFQGCNRVSPFSLLMRAGPRLPCSLTNSPLLHPLQFLLATIGPFLIDL